MQLVNPQTTKFFVPEAMDLMIISNATGFNIKWLLQITQATPYVMYIHDYWPACTYRLFYPMLEKCKKCKNLVNAKQLVLNSTLNIFLSPLHRDAWAFTIPEVKDHPYHLHPSPVDTEMFKPIPNVKRNPNAGLVVNAMAFKGAKNTVEYCKNHPKITFTFVGGQPQGVKLPPNCAYTGPVPYEKMPGMYNQASYYIELPESPQPFNRTVLEARLTGVPHLILNKNIGAVSYKWFDKNIETIKRHIKNAVPNWWKKVEEAMK